MKNKRLFTTVTTLLLLAGCAAPSVTEQAGEIGSDAQQPATEQSVQLDIEDYEALYTQYVDVPLWAGMLAESWSNAAEIPADSLVNFYTCTQIREKSGPQPSEGYPAEEVEAVITSRFDVAPEHIRTSTMYRPESNTYLSDGVGGGAVPRVEGSALREDTLTIAYGVYHPDDAALLLWGGELTIALQDETNFKYMENAVAQPQPEGERCYQYYRDPLTNKLLSFTGDGELIKEIAVDMIPYNLPYYCTSNYKIYYSDKDGIHALDPLTESDRVILEGEYSGLKVVGDRLYYVGGERLADGSLYTCDLNGANPTAVFYDAGLQYGKDDVVQGVSYHIEDGMIYYVAKEDGEDFAGRIRCFDGDIIRDIASAPANTTLLGLTSDTLFYSCSERGINLKTIYEVELQSDVVTTAVVESYFAILYDGDIYYTNIDGVYRYQPEGSEMITAQPASLIYAFNGVLYFSYERKAYTAVDLATGEEKMMPEDFQYSIIPVSYPDRTATNSCNAYQ